MAYSKIIEGATFGPGATIPGDRILFKNCTFIASVNMGDHNDYINCTFVKCCPKNYTNQSKTGEHSRFFDSKLESVKVGPHSEFYNTNKSGYLVQVQQPMPNKNTTKDVGESGVSETPEKCGQRFNSKEFKVGQQFQPCKKAEAEGLVNAEVDLGQCCK